MVKIMTDFEPKIVAFLCNWCAYAGADLAGVSRIQHPSNLRTVRVMCSGRIDPLFTVQALKSGADGVLVAGWHFGDCHYLEGNIQAEKKILMTQKLLEISGIGGKRLHLAWLSSAEAQRFVDISTAVINDIKEQGKFEPAMFSLELGAVEDTLMSETLRWMVGKEVKLLSKGDVYGRKWEKEKFESVLDSVLEREYKIRLIRQAIIAGFTSVRGISSRIGLEMKQISYLLADMEKTSMVEFKGHENSIPVFGAL
jgi:F420-non-reducing hydrogenase iron-sulfur subunit